MTARRAAMALLLSLPGGQAIAGVPLPPTPVIRVGGSDLNGLMPLWEAGFAKSHPEVRFENHMVSGDAAIGALEAGAADIVANGREPVLTEYLAFAEVFGNDGPYQVTVATGSHEKLGRTWAQVIYVNATNPIAHLSMDQLERVFAGARTGGYDGYRWTVTKALPAARTIRSWGGLGLRGSWAHRPIHTYGYAPTGMSNFFEQTVFRGGTTWAPGYRQFIETTAKQVTSHAGTIDQMMTELEMDPNGIAWAGLAHASGHPGVKAIALSWSAAGPFLPCTRDTVETRRYPLTRSIFIQLNRAPGEPLAAVVRAFLDYVLSHEGQDIVRQQGEYLPLPPALAQAQQARL